MQTEQKYRWLSQRKLVEQPCDYFCQVF